jgi:hypothetical protein
LLNFNHYCIISSGEPEFLKFVKGAIEWRKKWHYAEMERQRLNVIVTEKENELAGKDHQVHFSCHPKRHMTFSKRENFSFINNLQFNLKVCFAQFIDSIKCFDSLL